MSRLGLPSVLAALLVAGAARAADPPDALQFVPASAQVVVKVENPRRLAEAVTGLRAVADAQQLAPVRAALDSTAARRFYQLLGYLERELGAKWPDLLDRAAGGGIALGLQFGPDPAPTVMVIRGADEPTVAKAFDLLTRVLDDELARQGAKDRVTRGTELACPTVRVGADFHAARAGAAVVVANNPTMLKASLLLAATHDPAAKPTGLVAKKSLRAARRLLPTDPLAWLWLDFAAVKQTQQAKDFFDSTRKDIFQTLLFGSTADCLRRSDFVAAGLYREKAGFRLAARLPAGRGGLPPEFALHVPPAGRPGSLPLLEPPGVLYSQSFYLDIGYLWTHRDKLVNDEVRQKLDEGERQLSKVLPGSLKLGELLAAWGPHHRFVVINQEAMPYKTQPAQRLPAFGYVATMADPKFGTGVDSALRSAGLLASVAAGLKLSEVEHDGVKVVAYRFPEDKPLDADPDGVQFNFEPCFAVVGDQFIAASTVEACKKLIAEVKRTAKLPGSPAVWRGRGYAAAGADVVAAVPEPFVTDAILRQGVGIEEARKQVDALAAWLKTLGTLRVEIDEAEAEYRFDVVWEQKKN